MGNFQGYARFRQRRYYAEIGLILPEEINSENCYRYYSIGELETMLLVNRLKEYELSLEEIKRILESKESMDESLFAALSKKKKDTLMRIQRYEKMAERIDDDLRKLQDGSSILPCLDDIGIELVEVPEMYLLSIRKMVPKQDFEDEYAVCYGKLFQTIEEKQLTVAAPPMVLFHDDEYRPLGLDTEFAVPVKEYATGTKDFGPGLCLKTIVYGSYSQLPSVYAKQIRWAEENHYENSKPLYEVYLTNPAEALKESELVTKVYYPVKKKA